MADQTVDLLVRKSKRVPHGEQSLSIRAQVDLGRRWAAEHGYIVRKVWKENLSAWTDIQRPKYDAAMDAVLAGETHALWVYALDRFSRKGAEAVIPVLGRARVVFHYERLDSLEERDRRYIIQRAEDAREYSTRLSYNITTTKARQREEGRWPGAAPYGLRATKSRRLTPDTKVSDGMSDSPWDIVNRIYKSVADGQSARSVAKHLNAAGIASPGGSTWTASAVARTVHHPAYRGWLTVINGKHIVRYRNAAGKPVRCAKKDVRLISEELARRAELALATRGTYGAQSTKGAHLLTGKIRCAGCGGALTASGVSYHCARNTHGGNCSAPTTVSRSALDAYIVGRWHARLANADGDDPLLQVVAARWMALTQPRATKEVADATGALRIAQQALEAFHADDRAGFYTGRSARYRLPAKAEAEARVAAAEERLAELSPQAPDVGWLIDGGLDTAWEGADDPLKRELIGLAIDRISVSKGRRGGRFNGDARCVIDWAQPDSEEDVR